MSYLCETCKCNKGLRLHHRYVDSYGTPRSVTNVAFVNCDASRLYRELRGIPAYRKYIVREAVVDDGSEPGALCGDYRRSK